MEKHKPYHLKLLNGEFNWNLGEGTYDFFGIPSTMFWIKPSLSSILLPLADEVGHELYRLMIAQSASQGTKEDYEAMIQHFSDNFEDGFHKWGEAVSTAGWGTFKIKSIDYETKTAEVLIRNNFELIL